MLSLLLGCHVDHQVHNTVAVSVFIIIPEDRKQALSGLTHFLHPFFHSSCSSAPSHKTEFPSTLRGKEATIVISGKKQSHSSENGGLCIHLDHQQYPTGQDPSL